MEDWEEFFLEKSRRRFEQERDERRRDRIKAAIAAGTVALLVIAAIVGLAVLA